MASLGKQISDFFSGNDNSNHDEGLRGLFIHELKGVYYAEKQAVDALGEQADAATTDQVRNAFLQHQEESRNQVARLEQVFQSLDMDADEGSCEAIDGLVEDARMMISSTDDGSLTRDAALIIAAQKVEHHEIAAYGSLHTLARLLGYNEAAQLFEQTLREEKNTDRKLTQVAESFINERAKSEGRDVESYGQRYDVYRDNDDDMELVDMDRDRTTYQSGSPYSGQSGSAGAGYSGSGMGVGGSATMGGASSSGMTSGRDSDSDMGRSDASRSSADQQRSDYGTGTSIGGSSYGGSGASTSGTSGDSYGSSSGSSQGSDYVPPRTGQATAGGMSGV